MRLNAWKKDVGFDPRWRDLEEDSLVWVIGTLCDGRKYAQIREYCADYDAFRYYGDDLATYSGVPGRDVFLTRNDCEEAIKFYREVNNQCDFCKHDVFNYPLTYSCDNCTKEKCLKPDFVEITNNRACPNFTPIKWNDGIPEPPHNSYDYMMMYGACMFGEICYDVDCKKADYFEHNRPSFVRPHPRPHSFWNKELSNLSPIKAIKKVGDEVYTALIPLTEDTCNLSFATQRLGYIEDVTLCFSPSDIIFTSLSYWKGTRRPTKIVESCNLTLTELLNMETNITE